MKHNRLPKLIPAVLAMILCAAQALAAQKMTAEKVMDNVVNALRSAPSLSLKMTVQGGAANDKTTANITLAREKFTLDTGPMAVFYDGTSQWTVDKTVSEVSLTTPDADEVAETNPLAFMQNYRKKYKTTLTASGDGTYTVRMTALSKSSYVRSATVTVSSAVWMPTLVVADLSTGQKMTVRVLEARVGKAMPISAFRYNPADYPGYELIDLR